MTEVPDQASRVVCGVCGTALTRLTSIHGDRLAEVSWVHGFTGSDHDPQPVPSNGGGSQLCDFCSRPAGVAAALFVCRFGYVAVAQSIDEHGRPVARAAGVGDPLWLACSGCASLITAGRRDELLRRAYTAVGGDRGGMPLEGLLRGITDAHAVFFATEPGPPRPATVTQDGRMLLGDAPPRRRPRLDLSDAANLVAYVDDIASSTRRLLCRDFTEATQIIDAIVGAALHATPVAAPADALERLRRRPHGQALTAEVTLAGRLTATRRLWAKGRLTYAVDPSLWQAIGDVDDTTTIPCAIFRRLPHPDPFVAFPQPLPLPLEAGTHRRIVGMWITGRRTSDKPEQELLCSTHAEAGNALSLVLCGLVHRDTTGEPVHAPDGRTPDTTWTHLTVPTEGDHTFGRLLDMVTARQQYTSLAGGEVNTDVEAMLRRALALLIYLCAGNADLARRTAAPPRRRKHTTGKRGGTQRPPRVVDVGFRVGAELRADQARQQRAGGRGETTGRRLRPHIRVAHPHRYRVGPGRRDVDVKFLLPIHVNMRPDDDADQTTVVPVRKQR